MLTQQNTARLSRMWHKCPLCRLLLTITRVAQRTAGITQVGVFGQALCLLNAAGEHHTLTEDTGNTMIPVTQTVITERKFYPSSPKILVLISLMKHLNDGTTKGKLFFSLFARTF